MSACNTNGPDQPDSAFVNPQDLLIVDCLLPPQVRQLGTRISYLAARRGIRTSGAQCALRGGEYVAYDRADFKSALAVWLPLARQGDPEAQTYVGEIHEKGLGTRASFETAAIWYERAAQQNYARAQINLGYLYESGLGVERNLTRALNLYRQASGFTAAELDYVSSIEVAKRQATHQHAEQLQSDVHTLNTEMQLMQEQLKQQLRQLQDSELEVQSLRDEVAERQTEFVSTTDTVTPSDQRAANSAREIQLLQARIDNELVERSALNEQLASHQEQSTILQSQLSGAEGNVEQLTQQLQDNEKVVKGLENRILSEEQNSTQLAIELKDLKAQSKRLQLRIATLTANKKTQTTNSQQQLQNAAQRQEQLGAQIDQQNSTIRQLEQERSQRQSRYEKELTQMTSTLASVAGELQAREARQKTQRKRYKVDIKVLQLKLSLREADLATQASKIATLQSRLSTQQARVLPDPIEQISQIVPNSPSINIIDPPILITRGKPTLALRAEPLKLIGKVEPASTLFAFRINGEDHPVSDHGMFQFDTGETSPDNLDLLAVDTQGASTRLSLSIGSNPIRTAADTSTLPVSATTDTGPSQSLSGVDFGSYHALIIGNDSYSSLSNLRTAGNDAIVVERILREKYGFQTTLLLNANQKTLLSALERMRATLGQNDNLVIYYAGHGEFDRQSGRSYWLPTDAVADNRDQWIANTAITAMIETMAAKHVLVVADSCYSGTLTRSSIARPLQKVDAKMRLDWLKAVSKSRVRTVLSSGGVRPVLDGSPESEHSLFAREFIDALQQNNDVLEAYRLFFSIQSNVVDAAARLNVQQIPQYAPIRHSGHQAGEFIFVPTAQTRLKAGS